jgi:DNA-binding NtrC family response regulator
MMLPGEPLTMTEQTRVQRVLVVEDDLQLLRLLVRYLERAGMETEGTETAASATERFRPGAYTHVLADLTLPDGSGLELAGAFLRADPNLRVVLCSGYPLALEMLPEGDRERATLLQKPFSPQELLARLRP